MEYISLQKARASLRRPCRRVEAAVSLKNETAWLYLVAGRKHETIVDLAARGKFLSVADKGRILLQAAKRNGFIGPRTKTVVIDLDGMATVMDRMIKEMIASREVKVVELETAYVN
jgi:hypothetical protein